MERNSVKDLERIEHALEDQLLRTRNILEVEQLQAKLNILRREIQKEKRRSRQQRLLLFLEIPYLGDGKSCYFYILKNSRGRNSENHFKGRLPPCYS